MAMRLRVVTVVLFAGLTAATAVAQKKPAVGHSRRVFVNVTEPSGAPVLDLKATDFEVKESAKIQPILGAGLATNPMRIALMVDTSDGTEKALTHMRAGLGAFIDALPPDA